MGNSSDLFFWAEQYRSTGKVVNHLSVALDDSIGAVICSAALAPIRQQPVSLPPEPRKL
jgi:hypothetical protein